MQGLSIKVTLLFLHAACDASTHLDQLHSVAACVRHHVSAIETFMKAFVTASLRATLICFGDFVHI